jgi:hypothetical protein
MANEQNLIPIKKGQLSKEELKKRQRNGGKKSAKVRKEKKLISQIYAEFLAKEHDVVINGKKEKVSGQALVNSVVTKVLSKGKGESVSMLKELREATEGSKVAHMNPDGSPMFENGIKLIFEDSKNDNPTDS